MLCCSPIRRLTTSRCTEGNGGDCSDAGSGDAVRGLMELERKLNTPRSLREIEIPESWFDRASDLTTAEPTLESAED